MAYINVEVGLPGIIGLLEYRPDSSKPIRELTHLLLRGPSTLTTGERELIAALVSHGNQCTFCTSAHTAAADLILGEPDTCREIKEDIGSSSVSNKMKALLKIALKVRMNGNHVMPDDIERARKHGATDREIHDTVLISALFCLYNRYVDGLGSFTPENPEFYKQLADRIVNKGYLRPVNGYQNHKYHGK
jgi:uncharacterized peroxidase-related enzyme